MSAASNLLKQHLQQRQLLGVTHIPLRSDALDKLSGLGRKPVTREIPEARPISVEPTPAARANLDNPPPETKKAGLIEVAGDTIEEKLAALRALAETWEPARAMESLRQTMVFAVGDP
ncbi:MAG TPA: hypothetical protein DDZ88_24755, partial [Verrucomicrobiales bacterium]|nr:hypothetical protein [Verrucomicrobiales bacterium]